MTNEKAIQTVKDYTALDLLEALELIQYRLKDEDVTVKKEVRVAYYTLMAGFTELLG